MEFCPILLQINNKILLKEYDSDFLLQVWSKEGRLVYQRALHNQVRVWCISNEYLIYKPLPGDDKSDFYHLVNLKNGNSTLLLKDCIQDSSFLNLAYQDGILYLANKSTLYFLEAKAALTPGQIVEVELKEEQVHKVVPGLKIHGLFNYKENINKFFWKSLMVIVMETEDNQLDFSQVIPANVGNAQLFKYQLRQMREMVQREVKMDAIRQFEMVVDEDNIMQGIALRESGRFDIYWNMTLADSPMGDHDLAEDVKCSFDTYYFMMQNEEIKALSAHHGTGIHFEQAKVESDEFEFPIIFYQNIKNYVNIYNSFCLIRTTLYIVHGQFVSLYNIQDSQWLKHAKFEEGRITNIFKKEFTDSKKTKLEIAVLLENGQMYMNMQTVFFAQREEILMAKQYIKIDKSYCTMNVSGKIVRTATDQKSNQWIYIMTYEEKEKKTRLYAINKDKLYDVSVGLEKPLDEITNFIHVFCPSPEPHLVIQKHSDIYLYQLRFAKPELMEEEQESALGQVVDDILILDLVTQQNLQSVKSDIHSSISMNIQDHIFFIDNHNFYQYHIQTQKIKVFKGQNCVGCYVVDEKFCYTLSHSSGDKSSGLRLYDINNVLAKDTDVSYKLSNVQVGYKGILDWNQDYSRFTMLKSLDTLIIVPALHRNSIAFIGMNRRETYLATKLIKDKFIALDHKNHIFCWSVVTGKLLSVHKLPTRQDYSQFKIFVSNADKLETSPYTREWYHKVLLVKKEPEVDFDETQFYMEDGITPQVENQVTFAKTQKKDFREFRLIEIITEVEVKEHLIFVHPMYATNEKQRIYFDDKNQYMIEKLSHPRVFLYEKEESKMRRLVKWKCVKRLNKFPDELENDSGFLRSVSPSFNYFISIDRSINQFVIRDIMAGSEVIRIPKHLMNSEEEDHKTVMNRFRWVGDEAFRVINREGIEKLIEIREGQLHDKEQNVIPLFDNEECKDPLRNYFNNRKPLNVVQVKERLMRKYQSYKSAYYLEHKREPFSLYDEIFTVDYQLDNCKGMHVADMSFTFLHWKIMEQLKTQQVSIDLIDNAQMELLCYNILPGGDTIMHLLSNNGDVIQKIFQTAHPNEENLTDMAFHIPFIQNLQHESPMHICKTQQDVRTMDLMLTYLAGYGLDHHSKAIVELVPFIIEKQLPSFLPYLDSRLQQTEKLQRMNKGCLIEETTGIAEMSLWFGHEELEDRIIKKHTEGDDTLIDTAIKVEYIDMPRLYHYEDELCEEFFGQLADTDQYQIFEKKAIQKMIEFNYPLVKEWTIKKLFVPFMMFQATLFFYLNVIFRQDHAVAKYLDFPIQILLGIFACYFLRNELIQMKNDGLDYLSSVWNYIDIITPTTILTVLMINSFQINIGEESERVLQAIGVFFMWFKFLYFFRIFKQFGYLTRLIILVTYDMRHFLIVLFITLVAFGDTFLTISNGNNEVGTTPFVSGFTDSIIYTYLIILGSFEMQHFQDSIATNLLIFFFIMCTLFNTIVMLNLLIAIISETFSMVKENAENASYQEMASMISENAYLIPQLIQETYAEKNKNLMIVSNLTDEMDESQDEVLTKIEQLKKGLNNKVDKVNQTLKKMQKRLDKYDEMWERQEFYMQKIMTTLQNMPGAEQTGSMYETSSTANRMARLMNQNLKNNLGSSQRLSIRRNDEFRRLTMQHHRS